MSMDTSKTWSHKHYLMGALLFGVGLLIFLIFVSLRSQADDTTANISITNSSPVISSLVAYDNAGSVISTGGDFNLVEATSTYLLAKYLVTDANGCTDVASSTDNSSGSVYAGIFAHISVTPGTCTDPTYVAGVTPENPLSCYVFRSLRPDGNNYVNSNLGAYCSLDYTAVSSTLSAFSSPNVCTGAGDTDFNVFCRIPVKNYATAATSSGANWMVGAWAKDNAAGEATPVTQTIRIPTLTALNVSSTLSYSATTTGSTSTGRYLELINTGNNQTLGVSVSSTPFTCTAGTFPASYLRFATTGMSMAYLKYNLGTVQDLHYRNFISQQATSSAGSVYTTSTYFALHLPATGYSYNGSCTSTLTFTAGTDS